MSYLDRDQVLALLDEHIKRATYDCVPRVVYGWLSGLKDDVAELKPVEKELEQAGNDLARAAEAYSDAVDETAMKRALLCGLAPNSDHRPLAWDQLQQAEENEVDLRRALQRAVYYWRKCGAQRSS